MVLDMRCTYQGRWALSSDLVLLVCTNLKISSSPGTGSLRVIRLHRLGVDAEYWGSDNHVSHRRRFYRSMLLYSSLYVCIIDRNISMLDGLLILHSASQWPGCITSCGPCFSEAVSIPHIPPPSRMMC
jgi:hypothetical protein